MKNYRSPVIETVKIKKLNYPIDNTYKYDAQLYRSVDGGRTFYHCGEGRYCKTFAEAKEYKAKIDKRRK